ncbi:hypothetical protein ACRALDRAFT_213790 [Sodiomyces alcalophilus JCM 7366]|uniref:uncharacterized protein n=1 Tax=Sodiomyces alcalophilus JCM 7366 TaxID=591952 RepID=UPI0039B66863
MFVILLSSWRSAFEMNDLEEIFPETGGGQFAKNQPRIERCCGLLHAGRFNICIEDDCSTGYYATRPVILTCPACSIGAQIMNSGHHRSHCRWPALNPIAPRTASV